MPDFRVADTASEHPKLRAAGLVAAGLWSMAGSWSMNPAHMTDGWVPEYWVVGWPQGKKSAAKLVEVGLWEPLARAGQAGWQFHDWDTIQRSASSVEDEKRKARDRMARIRSENVRPNTTRTSGRTKSERSGEGSANVHDSLTQSLTPSGQLGGVSPVGRYARAEMSPPPQNRPANRCPDHARTDGDPGPCRACGTARRAADAWDTAHAKTASTAVRACSLCDADGWRWIDPKRRGHGVMSGPDARCDHQPVPAGVP